MKLIFKARFLAIINDALKGSTSATPYRPGNRRGNAMTRGAGSRPPPLLKGDVGNSAEEEQDGEIEVDLTLIYLELYTTILYCIPFLLQFPYYHPQNAAHPIYLQSPHRNINGRIGCDPSCPQCCRRGRAINNLSDLSDKARCPTTQDPRSEELASTHATQRTSLTGPTLALPKTSPRIAPPVTLSNAARHPPLSSCPITNGRWFIWEVYPYPTAYSGSSLINTGPAIMY